MDSHALLFRLQTVEGPFLLGLAAIFSYWGMGLVPSVDLFNPVPAGICHKPIRVFFRPPFFLIPLALSQTASLSFGHHNILLN